MTKEGKRWLQIMDASTKERHWPLAKTIKKIKTLKCEVVAVGGNHHISPDSSLKWRISYSLWERELIWSFQEVQFYCLVLLKIFLKRKLKSISEDKTTYHMKNVVIWESVNCSQQILQSKANFLVFIKKCLIRLRKAVDEQNLSHFIDRDRNLFDGELIGSQKLVPVVFECIGRNNLKELWDWC